MFGQLGQPPGYTTSWPNPLTRMDNQTIWLITENSKISCKLFYYIELVVIHSLGASMVSELTFITTKLFTAVIRNFYK